MRRDLIIGLLVSILVHGGVVWVGEVASHHKAPPRPKKEAAVIELIEMPKLEPDEPDVVDQNQTTQAAQDFAPPMQNDVPTMATDTSFVQKLQPPAPEGMQVKNAIVIPQNNTGWGKGVEVFDISKLDQVPVPILQTRPQYPFEMRRDGISGQVVVDFIVDTTGTVRNAYAASSSQHEFEASAVEAVSKWRFRPGKKGGRAVNTHMQVPIVFTLNSGE